MTRFDLYTIANEIVDTMGQRAFERHYGNDMGDDVEWVAGLIKAELEKCEVSYE